MRKAVTLATLAAFAGGSVLVNAAGADTLPTQYLIDSGASSVSAPGGWSGDTRYQGGRTSTTTNVDTSKVDSNDDALYKTLRLTSTGYTLPIENGTYDVKLHLVEHYHSAVGKRIFTISAEGNVVDDHLDIFKVAGGKNKAIVRTYRVAVTDGQLDLKLSANVDQTSVAAVEVTPAIKQTSATSYATNTNLPFDLPSQDDLRKNGKFVFAHYMPSLPVSFYNEDPANDWWERNYLNPLGESGIHKEYGGFARNRPLPVTPGGSNWKLDNAKHEIRQAQSEGIDGFSLDILSINTSSDNWGRENTLLKAASETGTGFKILLMPDMKSLSTRTSTEVADGVAKLAQYPAAHRLTDGRLVVAPFHAETHDAAWWSTFVSTMKTKHNINVALMPTFLDERPYMSSFKPISFGMGNWGVRNPLWNDPTLSKTTTSTQVGRVTAAKKAGLTWMHPISFQDERPNQGVFDEAGNTENLRNTWQIARENGADWAQMTTWNDYTENTQFAPSTGQGWSALDVNAYYLTWFKTGNAPTIKRDTVYVSHRSQLVDIKPTFPQTKLMSLRGGTAARDTVEALTFLTAPGTVTVTVGLKTYTCQVDAGVDSCKFPLSTGTVKADVKRDGQVVAKVTSPNTVTSTPNVQDFHYDIASSRREG